MGSSRWSIPKKTMVKARRNLGSYGTNPYNIPAKSSKSRHQQKNKYVKNTVRIPEYIKDRSIENNFVIQNSMINLNMT